MITTAADDTANPPEVAINAPTKSTFKVTDTKLYVPVVTLAAENDNKFLEHLKTEFRRAIK